MKMITAYKLWALNFYVGLRPEEDCTLCGHTWGPHELEGPSPFEGGSFTCPVKDCSCAGTWEKPTIRPD